MTLREATIRLNVEQPAIALKPPPYADVKKFKTEFLTAHKETVTAVARGEAAIRAQYEKTATSILRLIKLDRQRAAESQRNAIRVSTIQASGPLTSATLRAAQAASQSAGSRVAGFTPIQVPRQVGGVAAGRLGPIRGIGGAGSLARTAETFFPEIALGRRALEGIGGVGELKGGISAIGGLGGAVGGLGLLGLTASAPVGYFLAQNHANKQHGKFLDSRLAEVHRRREEEARGRILINSRERDSILFDGRSTQASLFGQSPLKARQILNRRIGTLQGSLQSETLQSQLNGQSQEAYASGVEKNLTAQKELVGLKQQQLRFDQQSNKERQSRLNGLQQEVLLSGQLLQKEQERLLGTRAKLGALNPFERNRLKRIARKKRSGIKQTTDDLLFLGQFGDQGRDLAKQELASRSGPQELIFEEIIGAELESKENSLKEEQDTKVRRYAAGSGLVGDEVDAVRDKAANGDFDSAIGDINEARQRHDAQVARAAREIQSGVRELLDRIAINEKVLEDIASALKQNNTG